MPTCLIIAANSGIYLSAASVLEPLGLAVKWLSSIADLPEFLLKEAISGILLELPTMMRASQAEKHILRELPQYLSLAKFRISGNELIPSGIPLDRFVEGCLKRKPRRMRSKPRSVRYLSVLLARDRDFGYSEKAITLNVSEGGCWLYTVRNWAIDDEVWIQFLEDNSVVRGRVRSCVAWGQAGEMPGIGIEYAVSDLTPCASIVEMEAPNGVPVA